MKTDLSTLQAAMNNQSEQLEQIATNLLEQSGVKPHYSNRDFMNTVIIFHTALMDKMYDLMNLDKMPLDDRLAMANKCGEELRKIIHTFTGLDTHKIEDFL
jgi:hypothetical protein